MVACRPEQSTASDHPTNTLDSHLPAETQHPIPSYSGPTPKPESSSSSGSKDHHTPPDNSGGTSSSSTSPTKQFHSPPDSSASKDSSSTAPSLDSSSKDSSGASPGPAFSGGDFSHGSKSSKPASGPSGPVDISSSVDISKGSSSSGMLLNTSHWIRSHCLCTQFVCIMMADKRRGELLQIFYIDSLALALLLEEQH